MAAFVKFDPWASLAREDKPETFAGFATFAALHRKSENLDIKNPSIITEQSHHEKNQKQRPTPAKAAKVAKVDPPGSFTKALAGLEQECPAYVEPSCWLQCIEDGHRFLATRAEQAHALGWTAEELFDLHEPPANPHPTYSRLSRYDCTGLIWLLQGRSVVALTEGTAAIQNPNIPETFSIIARPISQPSGHWAIRWTTSCDAKGRVNEANMRSTLADKGT